jgi:hypothetical protein
MKGPFIWLVRFQQRAALPGSPALLIMPHSFFQRPLPPFPYRWFLNGRISGLTATVEKKKNPSGVETFVS